MIVIEIDDMGFIKDIKNIRHETIKDKTSDKTAKLLTSDERVK